MKPSVFVPVAALAVALHWGGAAFAQSPDAALAELAASYAGSFNAGSAAEVAAFYAEDAVIMAPNQDRTEGRAAIEAAMDFQIQQLGARDLTITVTETIQHGDAIIQNGTFSMTINGPGGEMQVNGDWLSVAEADADGNYLITRHIYNNDLPPMPQ